MIKHFKPRHQSKMNRYSTLKIFKVEVVVVEVVKMVEVVKTYKEKRQSSEANWRGRECSRGRSGRSIYSNIQCYKCHKYGHYANDCNSDKCYNCGRVGHFLKDCRVEKKVEETINLALDDATNEGILLLAKNEGLKRKEHGGAKDDGSSREAMEAVGNGLIRNGFGEFTVSEMRK